MNKTLRYTFSQSIWRKFLEKSGKKCDDNGKNQRYLLNWKEENSGILPSEWQVYSGIKIPNVVF